MRKIVTDTASGKLAARPELDKALAYLRGGDVLVITRLSRAMRSLKHLLALADELRECGAGLVVLKQQIDTTPGRAAGVPYPRRDRRVPARAGHRGHSGGPGRGPGQRPRRGPQAQAERPAGRDHPPDASPDGRRQHTVAEIAEAVSVHRATVYDYLTRQG
jgi:DNA invertase Pin-like site-specific DNA recombinase